MDGRTKIWKELNKVDYEPIKREYYDGGKLRLEGDLLIWWIPQVPGKPFHAPVKDVEEAKRLLVTLARYDLFQYENNIKPDYANVGGLLVLDEDGEWGDWHDPETGDDIHEMIRNKESE